MYCGVTITPTGVPAGIELGEGFLVKLPPEMGVATLPTTIGPCCEAGARDMK
jgi:hypothetical protein